MKVKEILIKGIAILKENNIEESTLKAKIILSNLLKISKEQLLIHDIDEVEESIKEEFLNKIERLKNNEPIQYIINKQEFMGLEFYVDENVLIPQPDTEILVEEVLKIIEIKKLENINILDLCTGSGAIAISLAQNFKKAKIYASDISEKALQIAKKNSKINKVDIIFKKSNLFTELDPNIKFDIIVSNPPYIETNTISSLSEEVKKEPIIALDGGNDGLEFYKKITKEAKKYLNTNGILALEIGYNQKENVEKMLIKNSYNNIYSKKDLSGNDRIVIGENK